MRRTVFLAGIPFISAFLGGVLAISVMAPSRATAQSSQLQEVRASAFTLVGSDGTTIATLSPSPLGNGILTLNDGTGTKRSELSVAAVNVWDADGTTLLFRAGAVASGTLPPVRGVLLPPGGWIGMLPSP